VVKPYIGSTARHWQPLQYAQQVNEEKSMKDIKKEQWHNAG
jgi:hypothetical protein